MANIVHRFRLVAYSLWLIEAATNYGANKASKPYAIERTECDWANGELQTISFRFSSWALTFQRGVTRSQEIVC
jgi:hypothetical protein